LIRIGSSTERPGDAFAAVRYRGHWFVIDDHDLPSKRLFTFLMFIFALVETGSQEGTPRRDDPSAMRRRRAGHPESIEGTLAALPRCGHAPSEGEG
jgi:hypothetical protein